MKTKKIKIGIDIDEVLRAKWLQFDKYYVEEFGEDGTPEENPYTQNYFNNYVWKDVVEKNRYLKEPEDTPEKISPIDYLVDESGESPADSFIFKMEESNTLSAKEVYNRFMYEDYVLEIHGSAPLMYKRMELDIDKFIKKYEDFCDFVVLGKENWFSIPPTLFFLSKTMMRFKEYRFHDNYDEYWSDDVDIVITCNPDVMECKPNNKKHIKLDRPYNTQNKSGLINNLLHVNDLINSEKFEKIIGYKKDEKNGKV